MNFNIRLLSLVLFAYSSLIAYDFLGYKWPGSNPVYEFYINEEGTEDVADEWAYLKKAAEVWSNVPTTVLNTKYMGMTNVKKPGKDGRNILVWAKGNEWPLGGNVIAITCNWHRGTVLEESDIIFNARNYKWSTTGEKNTVDVGNIATHEMGHALGLDDSKAEGALMLPPTRQFNTQKRVLAPDDSLGITVLYPRTLTNNNPPEVTSTTVTEAIAGLRYTYQVEAEDLDGDNLTYELTNYPLNMKIDSVTGLLSWFPKFLDLGNHSIMVKISDPMGGTGFQAFNLNVSNLVVYSEHDEIGNGDTLYHEIKVTPMDEYGVLAGNIEVNFAANKMAILEIDTLGSAISGASFVKNITGTQIKVAFAGAKPYTGAGILFRIKLIVYPEACGQRIAMNISKALFNDGDPVATTNNGSVFMPCRGGGAYGTLAIDGKATYFGNNLGVRKVKMSMEAAGKTVLSNEDGFYALQSIPRMMVPFRITAEKDSGDIRTAVGAYDASLILRYVVGLHALKAFAFQIKTADVNDNNMVTAYDAALILRFLVGENDLTKIGHWVLIKDELPFNELIKNLHNVNVQTYMIGDVSGNWKSSDEIMAKRALRVSNELLFSQFKGQSLQVDNTTRQGYSTTLSMATPSEDIYSGEFEIGYDHSKYDFHSVTTLALLNGFILKSTGNQGSIKVVFAGTEPLIGAGDLFQINILPKENVTSAPLEGDTYIARSRMNESAPQIVAIGRRDTEKSRNPLTTLKKVFPNPFHNHVSVEFSLSSSEITRISIYDLQGKELAELVNKLLPAGDHTVSWNGKTKFGVNASPIV